MKLLIVESPVKAKKIASMLTGNWEVIPTFGHIEDLPKYRFGVDILHGFIPKYEIIPGKEKVVENLQQLSQKADVVYIGTDPDREGEAIAYSITKYLPKGLPIYRVSFTSVTKSDIFKAFTEKRKIDLRLVQAAYARRVIDRMVGYILSPIVSACLKGNFSVGRVQSPVLYMIFQRDLEIQNFTPQVSYYIQVLYDLFGTVGAASWTLSGVSRTNWTDKNLAQKVMLAAKNGFHRVKSISRVKKRYSPPPPFVTATLQSAASRNFGIPPKEVMNAAQGLFERGLISYPRTDSPQLSFEAQQAVKRYILNEYGSSYYQQRNYKSDLYAQDSHECIRPADLQTLNYPYWLHGEWKKIADLIKERFIVSQMADAISKEITVETESAGSNFVIKGEVLTFDGFFKRMGIPAKFEEPDSYLMEILRGLRKGQLLKVFRGEVFLKKEQSKPPERYDEAKLVEELKKHSIGRPSTYAEILNNIENKGYVKKTKGGYSPSEKGSTLLKFLEKRYPWVVDKNFTKEVEAMLDMITNGQAQYGQVVKKVWDKIHKSLPKVANKVMEEGENYAPEYTSMGI